MEMLSIILLLAAAAFFIWIGYVIGKKIENNEWLLRKLEPIVKQRIKSSRAIIGGQFSEQLAPFLPDFKHKPTECRFIGKPIDIIVFKGMDDNKITELRFIEIKSGKSALSTQERALRDAIKDKKVEWEEYRIPEALTKGSKDIGD